MEKADRRNGEIVSPNKGTGIKVTSGSWKNVRKRLYPPFREGKKARGVRAEEDVQSRQKVNEISSISKASTMKFRPTVCLRKKQFPFVCTNIFLDNERIVTSFDTIDTSCLAPICRQNNEPCLIRNGTFHSTDVCQDGSKSIDDDQFDHEVVSDGANQSESHCYTTLDCGDSIEYVICENCSGEESSSSESTADNTKEEVEAVSFGYTDANEYSEFHGEDYERSDVTTNKIEAKSNPESPQNAELLQDPLVSHRLTMPYKDMPLSRYRIGGSFDDSKKTIFLAKRPRSPVRNIQKGRFDVGERIAEVTRPVETYNAKHVQQISKEPITGMEIFDFTSPTSNSNDEPLTILLKALLDDVKLSPSDYENDLIMTLTTVWAIKGFEMSKTGSRVTESITISNLGVIPRSKRSLSYNLTLLTAAYFGETSDLGYPPKGSGNHSLHRALPWAYLCAAHAEGEEKVYDTVRGCIDEMSPQIELKKSTAVYRLADISCQHSREPVTLGRHVHDVAGKDCESR